MADRGRPDLASDMAGILPRSELRLAIPAVPAFLQPSAPFASRRGDPSAPRRPFQFRLPIRTPITTSFSFHVTAIDMAMGIRSNISRNAWNPWAMGC